MENGKFHPHNSNSENSVSSDVVTNQNEVEPELDSNEVEKLKHRKD